MAFTDANVTRFQRIPLASQSKSGTGASKITFQIPQSNILSGIALKIRATVTGTLSAPNASGFASIINRIRLYANGGLSIVDVSGVGYGYLMQEMTNLQYGTVLQGGADWRTAVTATTATLDAYIPLAVNFRDPIGLLMLQTSQTQYSLDIEFNADSTVATGATVAVVVTPVLEVFTVPNNPQDYPDFSTFHVWQEDSAVVSGAGQYSYNPVVGNVFLQIYGGFGVAASGSDAWSSLQVKAQQTGIWQTLTPTDLDMLYRVYYGRTRIAGLVPIDYLGTSGLGNYGSARDIFNSAQLTDYAHVYTATGATTAYHVRRQLIPAY